MQERTPQSGPADSVYSQCPSDAELLRDLPDWQVADGEPDIRGWTVFDHDNEISIGHVEDLVVSIDQARVTFIILQTGEVIGESDVDFGLHGHLNNRRIPVPLDWIELDEADNRVLFIGSLDQLSDAPEYDPESRDFGVYYDYWSPA